MWQTNVIRVKCNSVTLENTLSYLSKVWITTSSFTILISITQVGLKRKKKKLYYYNCLWCKQKGVWKWKYGYSVVQPIPFALWNWIGKWRRIPQYSTLNSYCCCHWWLEGGSLEAWSGCTNRILHTVELITAVRTVTPPITHPVRWYTLAPCTTKELITSTTLSRSRRNNCITGNVRLNTRSIITITVQYHYIFMLSCPTYQRYSCW